MKSLMQSLLSTLAFVVFLSASHGAPQIAPTLNTGFSGTNSVVHCPTLQIAWDGLKRIVDGPVEMENQDALVQQLNNAMCPPGTLPEKAYVAMAGFANQGIVGKLEKSLRDKFGREAPALPLILSDERTAIVTYSYLHRTLPFPRKFSRSKTLALHFRSGSTSDAVQFFGATQRRAADFSSQVEILHYSGKDDFILRLSSRIKDEFIVLAKIRQPDTLLAGVDTIRKHLQAERKDFIRLKVNGKKEFYLNTLCRGDLLVIPVVDLSVAANLPELCDRRFLNKGFGEFWLHQVYQDVDFKMDETGATVRSTAYGAAFGAEPSSSSKPRRFVFNKPFMVTLWKDKAQLPYLTLWVASPDVLVPFKKEAKKGTR